MLRKAVFASVTSLLVLAACGDDSGDGDDTDALAGASGMRAGSGGARAGTAGAPKGGTAPKGGAGVAGGPGGSAGMGEAGMPSVEGGAGGEPPVAAGSGGVGGEGGTPTVEGGAGGEVPEAGGAGAGGVGGMDGTSGAGGEGGGDDGVGLVARFTFDENTGTTAADQTGRVGPATLSKATWVPGRAGTSAVELAADEAHVVLPGGLFSGVQRGTIATWVNLTTYSNWSRIFDITGNGFAYLSQRLPGEGMRFAIFTGDSTTEMQMESTVLPSLNVWKHIALTVDGSNYTMFVDGYPTFRYAALPVKTRTLQEVEPTTSGWLGKSRFVDPYLKAKLDDFQIHDEVLSQSEIADLAWPDMDYTYLRFDETTGTAAADSSDRDFDGTLVNGATWTTGKLGGAVSLSGGAGNTAGAYVSLAPQVVADCTDVTIALWAQLATVNNSSRLIDFGSTGNSMFMTPAADVAGVPHLRFTIFSDPAGYDVVAPYPVGTVLAGQWHHFAFTLTGDTGRIYFDGALIGTNPAMTVNPSELPVVGSSIAWLGRSSNPADPFIDGAIDDVRIACRAYTADEIRQLSR